MTMVKSHKKNVKIIFQQQYRNMNFEKMDAVSYTGNNDGVWWGIFKGYLKQNIIMAVLRKANAHSTVVSRLIKKSITQIKIDPEEKLIQTALLMSFSEKESFVVHISFYTTRGWNCRQFKIL